jgi:hypothetical protein
MKKRLIKALSFLPNNQMIDLANDTFLTGYLDGSDKIYGFGRIDNEYMVITGDTPYPISDMDKEDLQYVFRLSTPNIFANIKGACYQIINIEDF